MLPGVPPLKDDVRVALGQIAVEALDATANLERIARSCGEAASGGADLVLFPELSNIGHVPAFHPAFAARYVEAAEPVPGPFTDAVGQMARRHGLHVVVGVAERDPEVRDGLLNPPGLVVARGPRTEEALVLADLHGKTRTEERAERPVFDDRRPEVYGL